MPHELVIILEDDWNDKRQEAEVGLERFLNEDKLLLFKDCQRQNDLKDISNLLKNMWLSIFED
jgi:hypothetical protein